MQCVFGIVRFPQRNLRKRPKIRSQIERKGALSKLQKMVRVLVVDDEPRVKKGIRDMLAEAGYACQTARDGATALRKLQTERFDVVLTDIRMPGMDGLELAREVTARTTDTEIIAMTGFDMDYSYTQVINAGAADFIIKPIHCDELQARINRVLNERSLKQELMRLANEDHLTRLYNRRCFFRHLPIEVVRAKRQKHDLSCVFLDIDCFKRYNDNYGHHCGDRALAALGRVVALSIRNKVDSAFRLGGDEFAVLLVETNLQQAQCVAERMRTAFAREKFGHCTVSLGVAQLASWEEGERFIRRADEAMYQAKNEGGNRVRLSTPEYALITSLEVQTEKALGSEKSGP
jgi:two-component system cell cycle response regulator